MMKSKKKMKKNDRIRIAELFADGYSIDELHLMYDISIFRIMGILEKFGIDL